VSRNRKRVQNDVCLFKLSKALHRAARSAARRECVSKSRLVRTAVVRLLDDLKAGETIEWR